MPEITFHPDVVKEVKSSYVWYQNQAKGLGDDYLVSPEKVMKKTALAIIKLTLFMAFLLSIGGCSGVNKEQQSLISNLKISFGKIYLAKYGLEYPHTEHSLNRCIEFGEQQCLDAYNYVLEGKNIILSLSDRNSLEVTLDIILNACSSKHEDMTSIRYCHGGIMSLYFYNSPEQDAQILSQIKKYPKQTRNIIFNNDFFWYYNRPNFNIWTHYISGADIDWEYSTQKQLILDSFKKHIEELDGKPWVLR